MNLLITLDENYLLPCKVMLRSFFASNPVEREVTVYLLHSSVPLEKLAELAQYCGRWGAKLVPLTVNAALFENAPVNKRYPKEMYYRLLSPLLLPRETERVLYLDPDILVINSLKPLWETDLRGNVFAAASHTGLTEMTNELNNARLNTEHAYFNTGVLLMDLKAAREQVRAEEVFQCVSDHEKELILPDQDVFNILYGARTLAVEDTLWNYDVRKSAKYAIRSGGKHDLSWVMQHTAVLHFCGKNKPWKGESKNPFWLLYRHYMALAVY